MGFFYSFKCLFQQSCSDLITNSELTMLKRGVIFLKYGITRFTATWFIVLNNPMRFDFSFNLNRFIKDNAQ
jgi:hypothetical protein